MSCMSASVTPINLEITQAISVIGGIEESIYPTDLNFNSIVSTDHIVDNIDIHINHLIDKEDIQIVKSNISVYVTLTCSVSISKPYLEISPEILWIWTYTGDNDVYSNTTWNVN